MREEDFRKAVKADYISRRLKGDTIPLKDFAKENGLSYRKAREWRKADAWDAELPGKKRGAPFGNTNCAGHRNAAGKQTGAPVKNKNAEKDGAYSTVFFDALTEEEKALLQRFPLTTQAALEHELQILKYRENKILYKIAAYEAEIDEALFVDSQMDMSGEEMLHRDSAFNRALKLQDALHKVQGRIAKVVDSIRTFETDRARLELEKSRLEIMRMRASGSVEVQLPEEVAFPNLPPEDADFDALGKEKSE